MNEATRKFLNLELIRTLAPVRTKSAEDWRRRALAQGLAEAERAAFQQLCEVLGKVRQSPEAARNFNEKLAELKNFSPIQEVLQKLRAGAVLSEPDLFRLKTVAALSYLFGESFTDEFPHILPVAFSAILELLRIFQADGVPSSPFSLAHLKSGEHSAALRVLAAAKAKLAASRKQSLDALASEHGLQFQASGELRLAPQHPARITLTSDERIQLALSTPFELIFRALPSPQEIEDAAEVGAAEERVANVENELCAQISAAILARLAEFELIAGWLVSVDAAAAAVHLCEHWDGCWPVVGEALRFDDGIAPAVLENHRRSGRPVQRISAEFASGLTVISGANMGGKTAALALAGCIQALGAAGHPAPARQATYVPDLEPVYIGPETGSFDSGLSSFGTEMAALAEVFRSPAPQLLLLDEPARGTNPEEGSAICGAICLAAAKMPGITVVCTHHDLPSELAARRYAIAGLSAIDLELFRKMVDEQSWKASIDTFLDHRLIPEYAGAPPREAIVIAEMLGLPASLLSDARRLVARKSGGNDGKT